MILQTMPYPPPSGVGAGDGVFSDSAEAHTDQTSLTVSIPAGATVDDIAFLHVTFENTSGPPTWAAPSGWTLIDEEAVSTLTNWREVLYWRRIDGSEGSSIAISQTGAGTGVLQGVVSLWSGYVASGTPYEALATATGSGTTATGSAITTLGANRTVITFLSCLEETALPGSAPTGWTRAYGFAGSGATGADATSSADYKDAPTAGAVSAESISVSQGPVWRSMTLALIMA